MALPAKNQRREPAASARALCEWSPSLLRAAEAVAETGQLRMLADLCTALRGDGRVRAALETRVRGLLRLPLAFLPSGDGRRQGRVVRALEAEEDWYAIAPENELVELFSWLLMLGVALARLEWTEIRGRLIPTIRVRNPRWLRYDWPTRRWMLTVDDGLAEVEVVPGDREWVLFTLGAGAQPWTHGAWKGIKKFWLGRGLAWDDFMRAGEVNGSPTRIGYSTGENTDTSDDVAKEVAEDLSLLGADASYVPPPGWDVKLLEATGQTWKMFPEAIQLAATEIAITLNGQNLSTEITDGVGTGATLHGTVRGDLIASDADQGATGLHDQVLTCWAEVNFGDGALAPWPVWDTEPPEKKTARTAAMKTFAEAVTALQTALKGTGLTLDRESLRALGAQHGLTLVDNTDTTP